MPEKPGDKDRGFFFGIFGGNKPESEISSGSLRQRVDRSGKVIPKKKPKPKKK